MLAIANALEGMSRAAAARAAGMDRQALRGEAEKPTVQWTVGPPNGGCNAEGIDGLHDRPTPGRPPAPTEAELALPSARIFRGPDPETDGVSRWTLPDLCRRIEDRFDKRLPPQSLPRSPRREGFSRQKTRPTHPKTDEEAQRRVEKGGSSRRWRPPPRPIPASG